MCSLKNTTVSTSMAEEYIRIRIRINHFFFVCLIIILKTNKQIKNVELLFQIKIKCFNKLSSTKQNRNKIIKLP